MEAPPTRLRSFLDGDVFAREAQHAEHQSHRAHGNDQSYVAELEAVEQRRAVVVEG